MQHKYAKTISSVQEPQYDVKLNNSCSFKHWQSKLYQNHAVTLEI